MSCLMKTEFPDTPPLVEGLIYPGLTTLAGAAKIGKSWAALQLVTTLDQGGAYLGSLKAGKTDVLYCALEDTPKRILKQGGEVAFNGSRVETIRRNPKTLRSFCRRIPTSAW
ncbi:AAA family ATPase [Treponema endosymbiont of Eucomonympha sp.]|uniref:AAA family ATPase n=1 Tax=Treponema endosymbiont of Eucomonympha sp. TaxID=1580831 RepID=UPI0027D2C467|nr:AAA family ATPase [Treponema endosymbiont of Eucomonympha sp.]